MANFFMASEAELARRAILNIRRSSYLGATRARSTSHIPSGATQPINQTPVRIERAAGPISDVD